MYCWSKGSVLFYLSLSINIFLVERLCFVLSVWKHRCIVGRRAQLCFICLRAWVCCWSKSFFLFYLSVSIAVLLVARLFLFCVSVSIDAFLVEGVVSSYLSVGIDVFLVERLCFVLYVCEHRCIFGRKGILGVSVGVDVLLAEG